MAEKLKKTGTVEVSNAGHEKSSTTNNADSSKVFGTQMKNMMSVMEVVIVKLLK